MYPCDYIYIYIWCPPVLSGVGGGGSAPPDCKEGLVALLWFGRLLCSNYSRQWDDDRYYAASLVPLLCVGCLRNCLRRAAGPLHVRGSPGTWGPEGVVVLSHPGLNGPSFWCVFGFDREGVAWSGGVDLLSGGPSVCRETLPKGTSRGPWRH